MSTSLPDRAADPSDGAGRSSIDSTTEIEAALTAIARYYDLDFGKFDADLPMYEGFAARGAGRVLELGTGTGRVAIALAEAGCRVTAVESHPAMRAAAGGRMEQAGVRVLAQDFRQLQIDETFDLVICALSTFCHLQSREDQLQTLRGVARCLDGDGVAVFDLPALSAEDWTIGLRPPLLEWMRRDPVGGAMVAKFATLEADPGSQVQWVTYLYDVMRTDEQGEDFHGGLVHRTVARFPLRHVFRFEMEGLLEAVGLMLDACYGSYDLDPLDDFDFGDVGNRLIVVARQHGARETAG